MQASSSSLPTAASTQASAPSRSQSPFFTVPPFHVPHGAIASGTRGSADNLLPVGPSGVVTHSPLLDMIHSVEHYGETHPDWGPFSSMHIVAPIPTTPGAAAPRSSTTTPVGFGVLPFHLSVHPPQASQSPAASRTPPPPAFPRVSSASSLHAILPFALPSKHGDGLVSPSGSPGPSSPTHSQELVPLGGGAPAVYESVAVAVVSSSNHTPLPLCSHCGSPVTSGRPHHHPAVPSPLHHSAATPEAFPGAGDVTLSDKKPRPLIQVVADTCKNCMERVSETAARGIRREMGAPGRTPYVNFRQ